jgi:hypothetical protein
VAEVRSRLDAVGNYATSRIMNQLEGAHTSSVDLPPGLALINLFPTRLTTRS